MNVKPWNHSLPCSYWLFLLPGAFCTDGVANWKPYVCLPCHSDSPVLAHFLLQLAWPSWQRCSASTSTLGVFDKSPDERAETTGLGLFSREPALLWRLWNLVGNRWCADACSHASYHIRWEDVTLLSASNLCLTQWRNADVGETRLPDGENRSSRSFWAPAAIIAFFKASDLPTGGVLMVLLASPRWPYIRSESLNRLPPVVWWGNAGVLINQAMVGVHNLSPVYSILEYLCAHRQLQVSYLNFSWRRLGLSEYRRF